ncbi:MAG: hypothetical protein GTN62_10280, partial [Gemmatimonadales bacterium]|nr:hypothetical protein [Gemmatimonadales bacterium]NIN11928.1 hypothetical protein [Gemmatimonadales bacterium]NIN50482.1 hypothetical protein [Gemmatimonadales bacterium]NIP07946.1 hypothetical protein [Gemmatimonadales bacterium]NIR01964.1 hypothetical protein [Gemmatimonadales bacterium]
VASGDQFLIFPSQNLGMAGVAIALDDPWLDPFVNPAKGARIPQAHVTASPTFYSISNQAGSAKTLPTGALFSSGEWFGGGFVALQQLKRGDPFFGPVRFREILPPNALSQQSATNKYAFLTLGRSLPGGVTVGGSAFLADLSAIDGVEHLYASAANIAQSGDLENVRFGVMKEFDGGQTFEALALYNQFDMTHDVTYVDWVLVDSTNWVWEPETRLETNLDKTSTWGLHLGYVQPVGTSGWRVGGIITGNRKSHPKIPNYEIMNIPRDPGHSWAYNIGVGLSKVAGPTTFGIDMVYEPAWSDTWAEAAEAVETASGDTIPVGGKTVENAFRFSNAFVNVGVTHQVEPAAFQLGLQVRSYDYHLDQWDNVAETSRRQDEQWMEWTPSWGARVRFSGLELRYLGRVTTGSGRPGVAWMGGAAERAADMAAANDILLPPSGPLTLQDVKVVTHQLSISLPIR